MMRKMDRWVGRHMTARRWIVAWIIVLVASIVLAIVVRYIPAQIIWSVNAALAALMVWGHSRRLR